MEEIIKDIPDYEGHYQVSNLGYIISLKRNKRMILTQGVSNHGHHSVVLYKDNMVKSTSVHRLVAEAFIPNDDPAKRYVNHIDGRPSNNNVLNLEWCSPLENNLHSLNVLKRRKRGIPIVNNITGQIFSSMLDAYKDSNAEYCYQTFKTRVREGKSKYKLSDIISRKPVNIFMCMRCTYKPL